MKFFRVALAMLLIAAFGTVALAQDFYVVKDAAGKVAVVDKKPSDEKSVVKGPFKTKEEAEKALKDAGKPKLPDEGC